MKTLKYFFLVSGILGAGTLIGIIMAVVDLIHHKHAFEATGLDQTIYYGMLIMYAFMSIGSVIVTVGSGQMMYRIHKRG